MPLLPGSRSNSTGWRSPPERSFRIIVKGLHATHGRFSPLQELPRPGRHARHEGISLVVQYKHSVHFFTVKFSAFAGKGRLDKDERRHARIILLIAHGLALFNYPVTVSGTGEASRSVFFSSYVHRGSAPLSGALLSRAAAIPCRSEGWQPSRVLNFYR